MEQLLLIIKKLVIFIIIFKLIISLVNEKKYEKYIRLIYGLLLIAFCISPIIQLTKKIDDIKIRVSKELSKNQYSSFYKNNEIKYSKSNSKNIIESQSEIMKDNIEKKLIAKIDNIINEIINSNYNYFFNTYEMELEFQDKIFNELYESIVEEDIDNINDMVEKEKLYELVQKVEIKLHAASDNIENLFLNQEIKENIVKDISAKTNIKEKCINVEII